MIRVTFADGYEDREDDSPCIANVFEPVLRHPSEERWYLWFPDASPPFSFCARNVIPLSDWRGGGALVWRITSAANEPLAGQWAPCRVESYPEQIARLTAERDEAVAQRDQAGDVLSDEIRRCQLFQRSTIKAEHERDGEKARADATEKRLADLRAWADDIVKRSREEAPKHPGKANTTWTILSVLEWVVARIDGKEG